MKTHPFTKVVLVFVSVCCYIPNAYTQTDPVNDYFKVANNYATIYNGEIELNYSPNIYENFPYLDQEEFTTGELQFKNNWYPGLKLRLDLFKDQLITLAPESHLCMIINPEGIGRVKLHNKTFIYLQEYANNPPPEQGYYQLLQEGRQLTLLARRTFVNRKVTGEMLLQNSKRLSEYFKSRTRYFLKNGNQYQSISNPKQFAKIFPLHRKSINQFLKKEKLKTHDNEKLLIALTLYCEQFTN